MGRLEGGRTETERKTGQPYIDHIIEDLEKCQVKPYTEKHVLMKKVIRVNEAICRYVSSVASGHVSHKRNRRDCVLDTSLI